jgi:hypothetical protein
MGSARASLCLTPSARLWALLAGVAFPLLLSLPDSQAGAACNIWDLQQCMVAAAGEGGCDPTRERTRCLGEAGCLTKDYAENCLRITGCGEQACSL